MATIKIKHTSTGQVNEYDAKHPFVQRVKDGVDDYEIVNEKPAPATVTPKKEEDK